MRILKWGFYGLISLTALIALVVLVVWPLPATMQHVKNTNIEDVPETVRHAINASYGNKNRLYGYVARELLYGPNKRARREQELILYARLRVFQPYDKVSSFVAMRSYYGRNASGIVSAANTYFCKKPADLSIAEAATLAAFSVNPQRYQADLDLRLRKRDSLIDRMYDQGSISEEERDQAKSASIEFCR